MVKGLREWYNSYPKKTFSECSKDDHDLTNIQYMTQSSINVIDFDEVKDECISATTIESMKSNDSLYFDSKSNTYYFVEFKNGEIKANVKKDLQLKIYDSFILLDKYLNVSINSYKFRYILVYNETKCPSNYESKKHLAMLEGEEYLGFGLDKIKGSIFDLFERYEVMNIQEFDNKFIC